MLFIFKKIKKLINGLDYISDICGCVNVKLTGKGCTVIENKHKSCQVFSRFVYFENIIHMAINAKLYFWGQYKYLINDFN